jgi:predicted RNA-binding Zn ribbon-like protein
MSQAASAFYKDGFGKVAPWVDLANSAEWDGFGKFTDHLANPQWLDSFLKHWRLYPLPAKHVPRRDLLQLRSVLRRAAEELATGQPPNPANLFKLNHALNVPVRQRLVQYQNGLRTELLPMKRDWRWVMARIAASLGEMLENRQAARIGICANKDCRWIFYDPTKARIKRWCNDRTCGNRARVRRARALQK